MDDRQDMLSLSLRDRSVTEAIHRLCRVPAAPRSLLFSLPARVVPLTRRDLVTRQNANTLYSSALLPSSSFLASPAIKVAVPSCKVQTQGSAARSDATLTP